jgi:hypothetical protein
MHKLGWIAFVSILGVSSAALADNDCRCLAVAGDIVGAVQAEIAQADSLYARADYSAALAIYMRAYDSSRDSTLLYAQAMAQWQLGGREEAKALFQKYLSAGGSLRYKARAEAAYKDLGGRVGGAVGSVVGGTLGLANNVTGGITGEVTGDVSGTVTGVTGEVRGRIDQDVKPPKVAKGAAIVLGVVAIAAVGVVGIHSIAAGVSSDIELDAKFDLGLGLTGVTVGITAIYLGGLTAATATAGSLHCATPRPRTPLVAPIALPGGGGLATAMTF